MNILPIDILTVTSGTICHQVNCQRKMGAGLALAIRRKWPQVYKDYLAAEQELGNVVITEVAPGLFVASLFAQEFYGKGETYTDYKALEICLRKVRESAAKPIHIPSGMGCGLGGGNWEIVQEIIARTIPDAVICRKENEQDV